MSTTSAIGSSSQAQEAYRSQLAQARSERQLSGLARKLDESARIGKVVGADTTAATSARQRLENPGSAPVESTRVSISSEAQARLKAEQNTAATTTTRQTDQTPATDRPQRQSFRSVDDAIAYGTQRASEQAERQSSALNSARSGETQTTATAREERRQTQASTARETSANATGNSEQAARNAANPASASAIRNAASSTATETSNNAGRNERVQFRSLNDAIAYGAARAAEQANASQAPETAGRSRKTDANTDTPRVGQTNASDNRNRDNRLNGETLSYGTKRALELYANQGTATTARS